MVDFNKRMGKKAVEKPTDPITIYDRLDRASDKGPLRKAQEFILNSWYASFRNKRDVIVKLHTGQGKTLIGLLILQSKLNEGKGPALYLCPNNQLLDQTCDQAKQFGIAVVRVEKEIPPEFLEGKAILVATVQRLFNGRTKFKLAPRSLAAGVVLLDDSHACVDAIRDSISIKLGNDHPAYEGLVQLFANDLEQQGAGTFEDIKGKNEDALLPVPYWAWKDRSSGVTALLAKHTEYDELKYVWPILKDRIDECMCFVSGASLEIVPYLAPLDVFGTYWDSKHRVFMSATVTDDSFLIKGLRLEKSAILNPLTYPNEKWSGEKMVLVPSLIDDSLARTEIVNAFAPTKIGRKIGIVVLAPSFARTADWNQLGAFVADKKSIDVALTNLVGGFRERTVVLVNRYDGIDLPDDMCRVLIFDSLPHGQSLSDKYIELVRPGSDLLNIRIARAIEQGLGRSVRGEKDYSVIIIIGPELIGFLRQPNTRAFLSEQTRKQVEIGLQVSEWTQEEVSKAAGPLDALIKVSNQCLRREDQWKDYYIGEMDTISSSPMKPIGLEIFENELRAETLYHCHNPEGAVKALQTMVDGIPFSESDKGYYLQEIARYLYSTRKVESNKMQVAAHTKNRFLLRPTIGSQVSQLRPLPGLRISNIIKWVKTYGSYDNLKVGIDDICSRLQFGTSFEEFERAMQEVGVALGFGSERPDKEWKAGPDNLWCLRENEYLLIEVKNEVAESRAEINKTETGQMNNAIAWFNENYEGARSTRLMVIPTNKVGKGAHFVEPVGIARKSELNRLRSNLRGFFAEFRPYAFDDLDESKVNEWLNAHKLSVEDIQTEYQRTVYNGAQG